MADWIRANPYAQLLGLLAKEFGYTLEHIGSLSAFQFQFLVAWLDWYYGSVRRRR